MTTELPAPEQVDRRLAQILSRGSHNSGRRATMCRLMLMLTRSCELRCSYCQVALSEEGYGEPSSGAHHETVPVGDMPAETLSAAIDLLVASSKPRLGLQTFGGEPLRRFDHVVAMLDRVHAHPLRRDRPVEALITTNGLGLSAERLRALDRPGVVVELSVDGDAHGNRYRRPHLLPPDRAAAVTEDAIDLLRGGPVRWFANVTIPPPAAGEVVERYRWARSRGAPALQVNYATGIPWTDAQVEAYLRGIAEILADHHRHPEGFELFNWGNAADPVPLCGDIVVDVDGSVLQVGAVFAEKRFPSLRSAYMRGRVGDPRDPDDLRASLGELWERTHEALDGRDLDIFASNVRLGAAVDLVVRHTARRLGRDRPPRRSPPG